ncbi:MAG TPA: ABC transporter permease, partial [Vicinamibacteria bacterium]|nr:ABC transporter permease [Vicinamibacteria bacterium]
MQAILQDLRYASRTLLKKPGFTLVAVASLALGIGLNTTIFSVVNAVLLKRMAVQDPGRLVEVYSSPTEEFPYVTISYPDYRDLQDGADAFEGLAAYAFVRGILSRDGKSELVMGEVVSGNYFDVLGVEPQLGRAFLPEEDETEGSHPVVVVSHGFWQRRLGGDPSIVGKTVRVSGVEYDIVGVAPETFSGAIPGLLPEFWTPTQMVSKLRFSGMQAEMPSPTGTTRLEKRGSRWLFVKGRLAPGRTLEEAQAQVATIFARLEKEYPVSNEKVKGTVLPGSGVRFHPMVDTYLNQAGGVLFVAVGLVLLIACANVANMLLARASNRRREIAVRLSVGASRADLLRQLMCESFVLAGLGTVAGLAVAAAAGRILSAMQTSLPLPVSFTIGVDLTVIAYAVLLSIATSVVFGLAPAWRASRPDLVPALKGDSGSEGSRRRGSFLSKALVVGQLAVSLVLLVAGALLTRALVAAQNADLGFDPAGIASLSFDLGMNNLTLAEAQAFRPQMVEKLKGLPGVEAVSLAVRMPLAPDINMEGVHVPGHHRPDDDADTIDATYVDESYFQVVGIPIVEGRGLEAGDREGSPKVVVVNQALAERYWPGESALGKRISTDGYEGTFFEVVGVARDHKVRTIGEDPRPYLHFAWAQSPSINTTVMVRVSGSASAALPVLEREILSMNPEIVFTEKATAQEVVDVTLLPTRAGAGLLGAFGGLALGLASVGLYGVIAYSVSRRTREVGLRMAMGARGADVIRMILSSGMRLALVGVAIGAVASALVAKVLEAYLYGISSVDPLAYLAAVVVLVLVAGAAN